ncbi:hypothetical protein RZS08_52320, partial [Arthrospira platensis SPKY1]|nr:hypothetical protein [Arthrospira platensis SPKY1]
MKSTAAPDATTTLVTAVLWAPKAFVCPIFAVPPLTATFPVNVLAPDSVNVPTPPVVMPPAPDIGSEMVV